MVRAGRVDVRLVVVAAAVLAALGAWPAPVDAAAEEITLQWVPVLDLSGPVVGAEVWAAGDPWLAYLGAGWEPEDVTDPEGYKRDGVRMRLGTVFSMSAADQLDLRVMHWPTSWVPGWDGTTGLTVRWDHLAEGLGTRFSLGAVLGDLWVRRQLVTHFLRVHQGGARFRALRGAIETPWGISPGISARPRIEAVGGAVGGQGSERAYFGAVVVGLPVQIDKFILQAKAGYAWPAPAPAGSLGGRLGFRAGGWPAEMLVRGAAPSGGQEPQRAGLALSLEREFALPDPPRLLWLGPQSRSYGRLYADWAAVGDSFAFSRPDAATRFALGIAAGVRGTAGDLQAFVGIEPAGPEPVVRVGALFSAGL